MYCILSYSIHTYDTLFLETKHFDCPLLIERLLSDEQLDQFDYIRHCVDVVHLVVVVNSAKDEKATSLVFIIKKSSQFGEMESCCAPFEMSSFPRLSTTVNGFVLVKKKE